MSGPSRSQAAGSLAIATPTGLGHAENRLIQYKQGSTVLASYTYDGDGTLVQKVAGGATTTYAGTHYEKTVWSALSATPLNRGVACSDGATGTGYLMYSEESVHTRFEAHPPHLYNADHFICVKYANGWVYDSDSAYYAFTPELSDRLVAAVDYSSDTVTALVGVDGDDHGIVKGYASGDLSFTANQWGGVANPGEFGVSGTQFTPNAVEVKSYFLGGQRVAIARNEVRFYLHADHLGSASLTTDGSGSVVSEMRYYPYGETRSGGAPTDRRYTGQREENGLGLYDYVARRYDPVLGRFLQADTIVPEPGDPQSLNRYSYVNNNPLRYVDPTGHEMTEWDWLNRWYNAHGYFWDAATKFWSVIGDPIFQDTDIAREVIAEAGIVLGGWYSWGEDSIRKVAFGVAVFGQKLGGGLGALTDLLGGGATIQLADKTDIYCGGGRYSCAPPSSLRGDGSLVLLNKGNFEGKSMLGGAQNVVHELAHVIDWQNNFSREWMDAHGPLTDYAARAPNVPVFARRKWEVWAEAVTKYVFGHFDADGGYVSSFAADQVDRYGGSGALTTQMSDMRAMLEGW